MAAKKVDKRNHQTKAEQAATDDNSSVLGSILGSQVGSLLGGIMEIPAQAAKLASGTPLEQVIKTFKYTPEQMERMGRAGTALKDAREVAGLTLAELSSAIDLNNTELLKTVEEGKASLPFETLLRLASLYSRNDPIPFVMKFTRTYNPGIWAVFKKMGLDKLTLEAERELQFINIYRSRDAARQLSDDGFEHVRAFTQTAFEMALHFVAEQESVDLEEPEESEDQLE